MDSEHGSSGNEATRHERPSVSDLASLPRSSAEIEVTGPAPGLRTCPACHATNAANVSLCSSCGEPLGPDPLLGKVVDERYEVVRRLGAGAMGAVYEVRHLRLGKRFAMKVIHRELSQVPEFVARFEREALSTSRLQHPNCILVTDFGHAQSGELYLVMEFLEGRPLSALLERPLPIGVALEITRQVLLGVQHAHEAGVIHRDLKPDNVVRLDKADGSFEVKVVDFGIAKLPVGSDKEPLTRAGVVFGTPQYMAPEQALGGDIGPHTDIYAIGAMLWRMITGRHVFEADGHMEVLTAKLSTPAPPLEKVAPGVFSPSLQSLLARCLERNPSQRLSSAGEMLAAIDAIRSEPGGGLKVEGKPGSLGEGLTSAARRLVSAARTRALDGGRTLAGLVSGWYRCEGLAGEPTWQLRGRSLFTTVRGAGVLALMVVALGVVLLLSVALVGNSNVESKTRRPVDPGIGTAASKVVKRLSTAAQAGQGTKVAPGPAGSGPFERAQGLLDRGACREATAEAAQGLAREPRNARGRYLLGAALFCQRMYSEALGAYAGAVALEPGLKKDRRLLDELERLARADRYRDLAFDFLEQRIGDAALPVFIRLASSGPRPAIRQRAVAIVTRLGAASQVDWLTSLSLDLKQLKKCQDRALVVEQLRQLKDVRAIPVLRAARDERTGWFGHRMKNYCARKQIAAALRELQALPGAEAYPAN